MGPDSYIANARMYATSPVVSRLWNELFVQVARLSAVPLRPEPHAWPADIEELWARPDLGLAFICGKPFRNAGARHKAIAVPLPHNRPLPVQGVAPNANSFYCTYFLIRADSPWHTLSDSFGSRLGWTVAHSHSGYNAVRYALVPHSTEGMPYPTTVGPLHTPNRCLEALLAHEADIVPMDSYCHALLALHSPERLAETRVLASSPAAPMPFFAASPETPDAVCHCLREALCRLTRSDPAIGPLLNSLALDGFAPVHTDAYQVLDAWEAVSDAAGLRLSDC